MIHSETQGLNSVKQLIEEGKIKEALQIILELEHGKDFSPKELLSYKLAKAKLLHLSGNHLNAIEIAKKIFQEFQKLGDLVSSLDALLIQAHSYMIIVNLNKCEDVIRQIEDLLKKINAEISIDLRERESLFVRIKGGILFFKFENL